ncbi:MAG: phage virion morphogenesis protein [Phaeobacter italicus]
MTGVTFTVDLDDLAPRAALARAVAGARDMTPLMQDIGEVLVSGARERIGQTNETPEGVPWPKSLRAQLGGERETEDGELSTQHSGPTLFRTGRLLESIIPEPEAHQVKVGSNLHYAGVHQTGMTITPKAGKALSFTLANGESAVVGSVTIPARPYLGVSDDERADITEITTLYFNDLLQGDFGA